MELRFLLAVVLCCVLQPRLRLAEKDNPLNVSSLTWATAMDADHLESQEKLSVAEGSDNDEGGFSSLDSMLQWAIGHSDPETLRGAAQEVQNLTPTELEVRQAAIKVESYFESASGHGSLKGVVSLEVFHLLRHVLCKKHYISMKQELMESLRMPSDADLMKIAIADLQNASSSVDYRQRALEELLELVEPIDNANDLHKLGGLTVVVKELDRPEEDLRILAAWILGKASQNNVLVQDQLLELGVLPRLMQMTRSSIAEEAVKALYAVSAIIRNHPSGQETFYLQGGALLLEDLMKNANSDIRLRRKSLFLVADLAEQQKEIGGALVKYEPSKSYLMSVVNLVVAQDLDTQEKALMAIRSLSDSSGVMHNMLKHDCDVKSALDKLQLQLNDLIQADDQIDFARDLQMLCQTVRSMFSEDREGRTSSNQGSLMGTLSF